MGLCRIELRYNEQKVLGVAGVHTYLVTWDNTGSGGETNPRVSRGTRARGRLTAQANEPWGPDHRDYPDHNTRLLLSRTVVENDESCDSYNESFEETAEYFNKRMIDYGFLFGPNSNTVTSEMLRKAGIDIDIERFFSLDGLFVPGFGTRIVN